MVTRKARVLVVEDDAPVRTSLEVALATEGYEVSAQSDARAMERLAEEFRPDLAIRDVNLAVGPDGYSVARTLRAGSTVPIIFPYGSRFR